MNFQVDEFFAQATPWKSELDLLRSIANEFPLEETYKWKQPCYVFQGKNQLIISSFKDCAFISFFNGVLLKDDQNILVKPGENSQTVRMLKFFSIEEITTQKDLIRNFISQSITLTKYGVKPVLEKREKPILVEELLQKFQENPALEKAFKNLTPGRQRGYILFFSAPKNSATKTSRIEKMTDRILAGKGINDCICGHSKKPPNCDGSHKYL